MINRVDLDERVREWGLRDDVVEKDYIIGWVLWGIGSEPELKDTWIFKGGTCLKKCFLETYRFSEDLDFTVLSGGPLDAVNVLPALSAMLTRISNESGVNFAVREPRYWLNPDGTSGTGQIYYVGPRAAPVEASIKLDLRSDEKVLRPTVLRPISHPYPEQLPSPATVRCYGFEELFAEKLRAMGERSRPRDLYDVVNLYRRPDFRRHGTLVREVLLGKCESKGVDVPTYDVIYSNEPARNELEAEWGNMLAHQLPALPPFQDYWVDLQSLFAWLDGESREEELAPMPHARDESPVWAPPATIWTWGSGVPLESVRFAAANHLCVELGYDSSTRLIEPYSLRQTKAGRLILHAIRCDNREPRAYRVDRIESVSVTQSVFQPVYAIEFAPVGEIVALPTARGPRELGSGRRRRRDSSRPIYIIECTTCGKTFRRVRKYNTRVGPHNAKDSSFACYGRHGFLADTELP